MSNDPLDSFINLVHFDQQTAALMQREHDLDEQSKKIKSDLALLQERVAAAMHSEVDARKEVDRKELEMQTLDQQEKAQRHRLDNAKNAKEYESARTEIESLQQKQHKHEDILIAAWNDLERATAHAKKVAQEAVQEQGALEELLKKNQEEKLQNQRAIDERAGERRVLFDVLPEEWRETYTTLADRSSNPAVPVESESCSACFTMVTPAEMMRLAHRALLQCKGCRRFLYLEEQSNK